ncbi:hypothetical protein Pmani_038441 [Petrolisthes manimaculis]|uniref:BRISC and BRCA1-A complex member 2 n=1 Tax=Petrolisthes manimaculis TaxID=1843537 RepID=A0AAE1TMB0_9EUCA|nr:hypothetical protein Pmani_038441 [Petrolisthes manimaculis]
MERFSRQVEYIKINGFPGGLCSDIVEIIGARESLTVKSYRLDNGDNCEKTDNGTDDELLIKIPFAGTTLSLHLLFYPEEPWIPPDLSFSDTQFASRITTKDLEEQVPSLNSWNCNEDDIIAQLLHQLLQYYKQHQLEKLEENYVLQIQYQSLLKGLKIGENDIEISVSREGQRESSLMVRLPLSLQDVPPVLVDANPGTPTTLLEVTFPGNDGVFVARLHLSPRVEAVVGGASTLALPSVPPGTCLMEYVEMVLKLLEERVRKAVMSFETRKQFVAEVLCQFGCAVIEYDAERFNKIVLLFEVKDFHFLAILTLGPHFPLQGIRVVLQSLYHSGPREPYSCDLSDHLKHNAQWRPEEMVKHMREAVLSAVPSFQTSSVRMA